MTDTKDIKKYNNAILWMTYANKFEIKELLEKYIVIKINYKIFYGLRKQ